MLRLYCEHGALRPFLRKLQLQGRIRLLHFPYDSGSHGKYTRPTALPSGAQVRDLHLPVQDYGSTPISEFCGSEKLERIMDIVGRNNRRDALHLDSAYKSKCDGMITCDSDILSKRTELQVLLGLRIYGPDESDLRQFIEEHRR